MVNISVMEECDRQTIRKNMGMLVEQTDIDALIPKLIEKGIFTNTMIEKYLPHGRTAQQRKTDLYLDIERRGPNAFEGLLKSLVETGHSHLAILLNPHYDIQSHLNNIPLACNVSPTNGIHVTHHSVPFVLPTYISESVQAKIKNLAQNHPNAMINLNTEPINVEVKQAVDRLDKSFLKGNLKAYRMGSRPKGYFFMINNIAFTNNVQKYRNGAEVDEANLEVLFQGLGYEVIRHRNLPANEMKTSIRNFAQGDIHKVVDSCVVAILSHGRLGPEGSTDIIASDGLSISTSWIVECFNNHNCPYLINRPKIFIFQSCRGDAEDFGIKIETPMPRVQADGYPIHKMRSYSDMLIAYSTIPGYVSNRDTFTGTWYIQTMCKIFMKHACDSEIMELLTMVDNDMRNLLSDNDSMQTSSFENWGFQKFYFNPGLYDDDLQCTNEDITEVNHLQ